MKQLEGDLDNYATMISRQLWTVMEVRYVDDTLLCRQILTDTHVVNFQTNIYAVFQQMLNNVHASDHK